MIYKHMNNCNIIGTKLASVSICYKSYCCKKWRGDCHELEKGGRGALLLRESEISTHLCGVIVPGKKRSQWTLQLTSLSQD